MKKPNPNKSPSNRKLHFQLNSQTPYLPNRCTVFKWASAALTVCQNDFEFNIRIVDEPEMTELNQIYRKKAGPTNVLAFPYQNPIANDVLLGDIVICAPIVSQEAAEQKKELFAHWAHLVVHGVLHLLGYCHEKDSEAAIMEALEIDILSKLGYANPYE